ncbi:hypothetical protein [Candidatus Nasuia deltocephalinicola]|uniref:hypothetical protein n=1 Tax=Candidatus Nasuia deltocephalincola TaxID=1160784 RepID=UPI00216B4874|nr:hypothetical protein [Candidatus Nasuia deltocephalinicola]
MGEKINLFIKTFIKFCYFLFFIFFNKKKIFFLKKYKKIYKFKKILICLNCHYFNLFVNNYKFLYKSPNIINQNIIYLQYSLILYKNFKRNSFYMNLISNYVNYKELFNILFFFKCF